MSHSFDNPILNPQSPPEAVNKYWGPHRGTYTITHTLTAIIAAYRVNLCNKLPFKPNKERPKGTLLVESTTRFV